MNEMFDRCAGAVAVSTFLDVVRLEQPDYFAGRCPFGLFDMAADCRLAPGKHGANRTGRPL